MSAWIVGLAIAAGYLINKNLTVQSRLTQAEAEYQGAAKPATGGVTSAEVRRAWKNTDFDTYGDFNADWSQHEKDRVVEKEQQAAQSVQSYDEHAEGLPQIQGVMLTFDRFG
jgi:hypothetical protein